MEGKEEKAKSAGAERRRNESGCKEIARTEGFGTRIGNLRSCHHYSDIRKLFDECPFKEVREACIKALAPEPHSDSEAEWYLERVKRFIEIKDSYTAFLLLRRLACYHGELEPQILDVMIKIVELCLVPYSGFYGQMKNALVILCGRLEHHPELYNEKARKLFCRLLGVYDRENENRGLTDPGKSRILKRVFWTIGRLKDRSFLPLLEKCLLNKKNRDHLMEYTSVCKDEIDVEGLRLLVIQHLKGGKTDEHLCQEGL